MAISANRGKIEHHIRSRTPFKIASMSGRWVNEHNSDWGCLDPGTKYKMQELLKDRDLYVVYSYQTPIAYAYDRTIHIPDIKYSVTTTNHQGIVYMADYYGPIST